MVDDGLTGWLHVPLPVPETDPPLLNVSVHAPLAVMVPLMLVLSPLQMVTLLLVIAATGRGFTVTVAVPIKSDAADVQGAASVREVTE